MEQLHNVPASIKVLLLQAYPRWGLENEMKECIYYLYSDKWGNAARIMTPPRECPRKLILYVLDFMYSVMYYLTSYAKL